MCIVADHSPDSLEFEVFALYAPKCSGPKRLIQQVAGKANPARSEHFNFVWSYMYPFEEIKKNLDERKARIAIGEDGLSGRLDWYDGKIFIFIFSWGMDWEHLSVSTKTRCPTWEEMNYFKDIFWKPEECCIQYFPRESQYVNNCPTCLHIWRPLKRNIPEPPTILLGIV